MRALVFGVLVATLTGCVDTTETAVRRLHPCDSGRMLSLGHPNPFDRPASFEVTHGPIWIGVSSWQPGTLDPKPYSTMIKVGPLDHPPVADRNGEIPSQTLNALVEADRWTRLDLDPGSYWLLAGGIAGEVRLQTCSQAAVRSVKPA